jgi:hypothetical protein
VDHRLVQKLIARGGPDQAIVVLADHQSIHGICQVTSSLRSGYRQLASRPNVGGLSLRAELLVVYLEAFGYYILRGILDLGIE